MKRLSVSIFFLLILICVSFPAWAQLVRPDFIDKTGDWDFSSADSLLVPSSSGATPTDLGDIACDSDTNECKIGVNGETLVLGTSGSTPGLGTVLTQDNFAAATSPSTGLQIGLDSNNYLTCYWDLTAGGPTCLPVIGGVLNAANKGFKLNSGFNWIGYDHNGDPLITVPNDGSTAANFVGLPTGWSLPIVTGSTLTASDDAVNYIRVPFDQTIVEVCAKTDTGTISVQIQRDDGSATNMLSSNLTAATTEACTSTFVAGEDSLSESDYVDVLIVSIDSGSPTRLTVSARATRD